MLLTGEQSTSSVTGGMKWWRSPEGLESIYAWRYFPIVALQAFIFMMLTVVYLSMAHETH